MQDGYRLTPLADWGKPARPAAVTIDPAVDMKTAPLIKVNSMSGVEFLTRAVALLDTNPPHVTDQPILARMRRLGIEPGKPVDGTNAYRLSFRKDELPPADAFWSVTLYDSDGFPVANALDRHALGDRDALVFNADGSLDLVIQAESPGPGKESNWLPAPKGPFNLTMRIYAPRANALNGEWNPPPVQRVPR